VAYHMHQMWAMMMNARVEPGLCSDDVHISPIFT
jgi:hypothetical protein